MKTTSIDRDTLLVAFDQLVRTSYHPQANRADFDQLIAYLRDGSVSAPVLPYGFHRQDLYESYWSMLGPNPLRWDDADERLLSFAFTRTHTDSLFEYFYDLWLADRVNDSLSAESINTIVRHLARYGVSKANFGLLACQHIVLRSATDTALTQWVLDHTEQCHTMLFANFWSNERVDYLNFLLKRKPDFVKTHLPDFIQLSSYNGWLGLDTDIVRAFLAADAAYFSPYIVDLKQSVTDPGTYRSLQHLLAQYLPGKYQANTLEAAYDYLELVRREMTATPVKNYFLSSEPVHPNGRHETSATLLFDTVLALEESTKARAYLYNWLKECPTPYSSLFTVLSDRLGEASVPFLLIGLQVNTNGLPFDTVALARELLKLLANYDNSTYYPQLWALTRHKSRQMRELAAVTLAKSGEMAIPEAERLLNDKKADIRQTGALLLSLIPVDRAQTLLINALDAERNDDARDLMLNSLAGLLPVPATQDDVTHMVSQAGLRGKLAAPLASYLLETNLPPLYWQTSGELVSEAVVRFLLYRQNRSKTIRPDVEAHPVYTLIDRKRSSPFAKAILKAYVDGGADPGLKGCLTIGAMLGGDDEIDFLKLKVNQWAEASRGKMAEYAVQALALVGTNRALRAVEFFARKYKNKNKNIGAAAIEAFAIAADTLGVSAYDLADSIIPDFGFTGLFREFEAGGETYRAFIDTNFKIAFLNEDNKLMKAVPKIASPAIKEEFKDIGREVRDIVKGQSGRLEQYLVIQRRWPVEKWAPFFLGNPIMFAYAIRLIWGVFDSQQTLLFTFQCQEDQTLVNEDDAEVQLPENTFIGMVHPLALTPAQVVFWTGQLADADVEPIFAQLNRRVVTLPDTDQNLTIERKFEGVEYGGYGFVSKMEKLGWFRGSVQDAGSIGSYYKDFSDLGITAILMQQGNIGVGYYDENAALGAVMFVRAGTVTFGSYYYNEPTTETDPRLIRFGEVPPIVYSEVMADMQYFNENDVRKDGKNHE